LLGAEYLDYMVLKSKTGITRSSSLYMKLEVFLVQSICG
jgi:hypothetical protein